MCRGRKMLSRTEFQLITSHFKETHIVMKLTNNIFFNHLTLVWYINGYLTIEIFS